MQATSVLLIHLEVGLFSKKKPHPIFSYWLQHNFRAHTTTIVNYNYIQKVAFVPFTSQILWEEVQLIDFQPLLHLFSQC